MRLLLGSTVPLGTRPSIVPNYWSVGSVIEAASVKPMSARVKPHRRVVRVIWAVRDCKCGKRQLKYTTHSMRTTM